MKIINLTLIALTFVFGNLHQSIHAMENPKITEITQKKKYTPKSSEQRKELNVQTKAIIRVQKIDGARWQKMQSYALNTGILIPSKKQKLPLIGQKKLVVQDALQQVIIQPIEKEVTNSIPPVQIEKRSELLENSEIATIQNLADLIENRLNDSTPEVKVENCSVLTENAAALPTSQLAESNSSLSDSQLEDFPIPGNLINQATSNASNNAIVTDKLGVNDDASSRINSNNSEDAVQNQLTAKRNQQIVKIAPLLIQKFTEVEKQPIVVQKELTQEEIIQMTRQKIDTFAQVMDTTYVEIFDKFITSTQKLPEPRTSGAMEFYLNRYVYNNPKQDTFGIAQLTSQYETVVLSLFAEIKSDLSKITDRNKRSQLIHYFKNNKDNWCMNAYYTEKTLNALMHDNKHKTSQDLDNITIKSPANKKQVTPQLYSKITNLTDECTNNMQFFGNTIYDKSNLAFEKKYRIEKAKAEKYELPQLIKTANEISRTISRWMITQLY